MKFIPYLNFDGDCEAAFRFYQQVLGGRIEAMQKYADAPIEAAADVGDRILHAQLVVGDTELLGADTPPGQYHQPAGVQVTITVDSPWDAERIFTQLSLGGKITMDLQKTFWSPKFGMLTDRFGIPWMISCNPPAES